MPRVSIWPAIAAALTLVGSCARQPNPESQADRRRMSPEENQRSVEVRQEAERDSFANLPPCALEVLGDTTAWRRLDGAVLALPPEFHQDSVQPGYMHGGTSWSGGAWHYQVVNGLWAWSSFGSGTRCQLRLNGREAMYERSVRDGRQFETVWLPDNKPITIGSAIFVADGPKNAKALLARAIQTHPDFGP